MNRRNFIKAGALFVPATFGIFVPKVSAQSYLPHRRKAFSAPDYRVNLAAEWDADSISGSDTDPVSTWPETIAGADATAAGTARPLLQTSEINGHSAVQYDGVNDMLTSTYTAALGDFTAMAVFKATSISNTYPRVVDKVFNNGFWIGYTTPATSFGGSVRNSTAPNYMSAPVAGPTTNNWYVVSMRRNGTDLSVRFNGTAYTGSATVSGTALSADAVVIGNSSFGSDGLTGFVSHVRIYSDNLSDGDVLVAEKYLGNRYAVTITP